jgi:uncharacterized protein (DUF305 family)
MKHVLRTFALPVAVVATLVLTSCGNGAESGTTGMSTGGPAQSRTAASEAKNSADIVFATMMLPHHAQAIAMADMAVKRATDPKVIALAPTIKAAQGPEIRRMAGWLTGWGEPVPGTVGGPRMSDMSGMDGMDGQTGGMMSQKETTSLSTATGRAFDRMWLQMMVRHHQGAVDMATTELAQGANPESKQLAQSIISSQSAEVLRMKLILQGLLA